MNVLVTGGAGYIGAHCCKELAARGHRPIVFDDLRSGHRDHVRWGEFFEGSTGRPDQVQSCLARWEVEAVMHFAAFIEVGESVADPLKYYANNVAGTLTLLQALEQHRIRHMVFSSSAAVYGNPDHVPIDEDHPLRPQNPYGWTKRMVESMLADLGRASGLRWAALRYFNAAGADAQAEIGEKHSPETHLIPRVLDAALNGGGEVTVYGTDYPTPDGTCIRDYIHVTDLAQAHVLALEHLVSGGPGGAFNLGQEQGYSVLEVIRKTAEITGREITRRSAGRRPGDVPVLVASARKARAVLGWTPRFSGLDTIIASAWRWHEKMRAAK